LAAGQIDANVLRAEDRLDRMADEVAARQVPGRPVCDVDRGDYREPEIALDDPELIFCS
jgi:hypothetical protein